MSTAPATLRPQQHTFTSPSYTHARPAPKKRTMSVTQTYFLAHKARAKLAREAAQPDHNLRLLVGHANLLDSLMLELADAERQQERWFSQSVRGTNKGKAAAAAVDPRVRWADRVVEQPEEEYYSGSDSDSDSDSDSGLDDDDDDEEDPYSMSTVSVVHAPSVSTQVSSTPSPRARQPQVLVAAAAAEEDSDEEMTSDDDLEEDYAQLELVRAPSHASSPPELLLDHESDASSDEDSDEESMPPSPADASLEYGEKEQQGEDMFQEAGYYVSRRAPRGLVSAVSVY